MPETKRTNIRTNTSQFVSEIKSLSLYKLSICDGTEAQEHKNKDADIVIKKD